MGLVDAQALPRRLRSDDRHCTHNVAAGDVARDIGVDEVLAADS